MRKSRKSGSNAAGEGRGRLLLHLGPGLRQAIASDEVYFVEAKGDDTEVRTKFGVLGRDLKEAQRRTRRLSSPLFPTDGGDRRDVEHGRKLGLAYAELRPQALPSALNDAVPDE